MAEYVNYLRVFGAPGAARALFGAIQDDTAGLGSVDLNRITPMPVWMREEPLGAGTVRRQGGENCWLDWRQANWGTRWNTLKAQACVHGRSNSSAPIMFIISKNSLKKPTSFP